MGGGFFAQAKRHWTRNHLNFPQSERTDARPTIENKNLIPWLLYHSLADKALVLINWKDSVISDHELVSRIFKIIKFPLTKAYQGVTKNFNYVFEVKLRQADIKLSRYEGF